MPNIDSTIVSAIAEELGTTPPYSLMNKAHLRELLSDADQVYYQDGQTIVDQDSGVINNLWLLRRGSVVGHAAHGGDTWRVSPGDLFPLTAFWSNRATTSQYLADGDTFCLRLNGESVQRLRQASPPFAAYCQNSLSHLVNIAQRQLQSTTASRALEEKALNTALAEFTPKNLNACPSSMSIYDALSQMHKARVGSILVVEEEQLVGIVTLPDVVSRIVLARANLFSPISSVMTHPVHSVDESCTVGEAMLIMAKHKIRHLPVTREGKLLNLISERDLFEQQKISVKRVTIGIQAADDAEQLVVCAKQVRALSRQLVAQGMLADSLTKLVSHLNDQLTARVLDHFAHQHQLSASKLCWLALGSEGRSEQTISTDQDNALIIDASIADDPAIAAFCQDVNQQLDHMGFPLCKGNVMASNPDMRGTIAQWQKRLTRMIEQPDPEQMLRANILLDMRASWGNESMLQPLRECLHASLKRNPLFLRWLAEDVLQRKPALNWFGRLAGQRDDSGQSFIDLKANGTAIFTDCARIFAWWRNINAVNTEERLQAIAKPLHFSEREVESWVSAFNHLQLFKLQCQFEAEPGDPPNKIDPSTISNVDRRLLTACMDQAEALQRRLRSAFLIN